MEADGSLARYTVQGPNQQAVASFLHLKGILMSPEALEGLLAQAKASLKAGLSLVLGFDAPWSFSPALGLALMIITGIWSGEIRVVASRNDWEKLQGFLHVPPDHYFDNIDAAVLSLPGVAAATREKLPPRINRISGIN